MTHHGRDIPRALAFACATATMPAEAHALGIGIVVLVIRTLFRPVCCVRIPVIAAPRHPGFMNQSGCGPGP